MRCNMTLHQKRLVISCAAINSILARFGLTVVSVHNKIVSLTWTPYKYTHPRVSNLLHV